MRTPLKNLFKLLRGGSWINGPRICRSAYCNRWLQDNCGHNVGFRLCGLISAPISNVNTMLSTTSIEMIAIPPGEFLMGSPPEEEGRFSDEGPQHLVRLQGFFLSKTPITQAQWREVAEWEPGEGEAWGRSLNPSPSYFKCDNRPVERVSWEDAMEFCSRLSQRTGRTYTLPSEAQWEYACRAGTTTPFHFGNEITRDLARFEAKATCDVAKFPPNAWGLCDMHGNVWEWCLDEWHQNYQGAPLDGSAWEEED